MHVRAIAAGPSVVQRRCQPELSAYDRAWGAYVETSWAVDARRRQGTSTPADEENLARASRALDAADGALVRAIVRSGSEG